MKAYFLIDIRLKNFIIFVLITFSQLLYAIEISHGEMAGIIRSAGYPCAKVIELQPISENSWRVQCNAGNYTVVRDEDRNYNVTTSE